MSDTGQPMTTVRRRGYEVSDIAHAMLKAVSAIRQSNNTDELEGMIRREYQATFGPDSVDKVTADEADD